MTAIPILPDLERRTTYNPVASVGPFDVGFAVYGDGTDYENWLQVQLDGVDLVAVTAWTLASPSGTLATLARPITDAQITPAGAYVAGFTGELTIIGHMRPRRTSQLQDGVGVSAHDFNKTVTEIKATQRENYDLLRRQDSEGMIESVAATAADRVQTGLDRVATGVDVTAAQAARTGAENAETNAETAQAAAEAARTGAETAETNAELAETNAETAETNAETAQAAAEVAQAAAEAAQTGAEAAETNAETAQAAAEAAAATAAGGHFAKLPVVAATTAALPANTYANGAAGVGATLTGNANGPFPTVDGVAAALNNEYLIKDEAAPANNGVYKLTQLGVAGASPYILTRRTDTDTAAELARCYVLVTGGTTLAGYGYVLDLDTAGITVGTTALVFGVFNYKFSTGTQQAVGNNTSLLASTSFVQQEKGLLEAIQAALANGNGTLKCLFHDGGPRTHYAGSDSIITQWNDVSPAGLTAGLYSTIFSGIDPRPRIVTGKGLYFGHQAGLTVSNGILSKTTAYGIHYVFEIPLAATYALKADMLAASANSGDIAEVTADTKTTYSPDDTLPVENNSYADSVLVNGFWRYSAWDTTWGRMGSLFALRSAAGTYLLQAFINGLGEIVFYHYSASLFTTPNSNGKKVVGNGRHHLFVARTSSLIIIYLDGLEVASLPVTAGSGDIADLDKMYINGSSRTASTTFPVSGTTQYVKAIAIVDDWTWDGLRNSHDALADHCGTPRMEHPREVWGVLKFGQSLSQGSTSNSDTWTNANGWNGMINSARTSAPVSTDQVVMTKEFFPRCFSHRGTTSIDNFNISALQYLCANGSLSSSSHEPGSSGENIEQGMAKWLINYTGMPKVSWLFMHAEASPGAASNSIPLWALKSTTYTALTGYGKLLRAIVAAKEWALARGQIYKVKCVVGLDGLATAAGATYITFYDQLMADVKAITGQNENVVLLMPPVSVSSNGTSNTSIAIDQKVLDAVALRGSRPISIAGATHQYSNHTHYYRAMYRAQGELYGRALCKIIVDGIDWRAVSPNTVTRGANYVDIKFYLQSGRQLQFVDTNQNNIDARVTSGGVDTYGFGYSGGGLTITGVTIRTTTTTNDTVRVSLSGAPQIGHSVSYVKDSRIGNLCDDDPAVAYFRDQDWTVAIVAGKPTFAEGELNDMRNWAVPFDWPIVT